MAILWTPPSTGKDRSRRPSDDSLSQSLLSEPSLEVPTHMAPSLPTTSAVRFPNIPEETEAPSEYDLQLRRLAAHANPTNLAPERSGAAPSASTVGSPIPRSSNREESLVRVFASAKTEAWPCSANGVASQHC